MLAHLSKMIPRPFRDIIHEICPVTYYMPDYMQEQIAKDRSLSFAYQLTGFTVERPYLAKEAAIRLAAIAIAFFITLTIQITPAWNIPIIAAGTIASLPCVLIVAGCHLLYDGSLAIISAITTASFEAFSVGLVLSYAGWKTLEHHDIFPLGIIDIPINIFLLKHIAH